MIAVNVFKSLVSNYLPVDKYEIIGPYSFNGKRKIYLVLLDEVHTPIPCEGTFCKCLKLEF